MPLAGIHVRRGVSSLSVLLAATALLAACGGDTTTGGGAPADGGETLGPGVSADAIELSSSTGLTGNFAVVTAPYVAAAKAKFAAVNADGGVNGRKINWKPVDDGFDIQRAVSFAQRLVSQNKILAETLPFGTAPTVAKKEIYEAAGVPFVSLGTTYAEVENAKTTFGCTVPYYSQARVAIRYAIENRNAKRIGVLVYASPDGKEVGEAAEDEAKAQGAEVVRKLEYDPGTTDFSGAISDLRGAKPDVVVLYGSTPDSARAIQAARRAGLKVPFIGPQTMADSEFLRLAGDAAEGVIAGSPYKLPDADDPGVAAFRDALSKNGDGGSGQPTTWAMSGYQCASVVAAALDAAGEQLNRESFVKGIESLKDFDSGIAAPVSFGPDDHTGSTMALVLEVKDGAFKQLSDFEDGAK
ncbi:MAG TPA: ABC transporter substrate-binding protein [Solirubrobacter sp.]|nr:ABC transporter substrate-binding protein [Solirubrobacter sp.]